MATRKDISFKAVDGTVLRGWLYTPSTAPSGKTPCLVMSHGFTAIKEMDLDAFAEVFSSKLPLACLVYDNRNFGASDGEPRQEIIPAMQHSDMSDAITYAQSLDEIDPEKIGIWGSSYSGGHVLHVGAVDRRVKAVLCQVPLVDGWANFHALVRPDFVKGMEDGFQQGQYSVPSWRITFNCPKHPEAP
jgi:cephalosporin-C deacetylase-like acetyl esterase